jgi:hypothetical protein
MLDQFDVGVFANIGSTSSAPPAATVAPVKSEYVDRATFEILTALAEKAAFLEAELSRVLGERVDIAPASRFRKYFEHQVTGVLNVSSVQRTGSFGGAGIKGPELTRLLVENERIAVEILAVLDAGPAEYAQFSKELNEVSAKYGLPLIESSATATRLDKPALLKAMMVRMNSNYAMVKRQMAVNK